MSRNKDPAVLFYTSDFLSGTRLMNYTQIGKYITLLCLQHQLGHLSEEDMQSICEKDDSKLYSKFVKDENGLYYNERMEEEIIRRATYSQSRSENGKKGGRPASKNHMLTICNAYEKHSENENINENINITVNEDINHISIENDRFDLFWQAYPRKTGKAYAKKCFDKLKPSAELTERMIKAIEEQKRSLEWKRDNGQYIPNPSTWLNQGRWDDELRRDPTDHTYTQEEQDRMGEEAMRQMDKWFGEEN